MRKFKIGYWILTIEIILTVAWKAISKTIGTRAELSLFGKTNDTLRRNCVDERDGEAC